jgi:signal transduction histidine kinase
MCEQLLAMTLPKSTEVICGTLVALLGSATLAGCATHSLFPIQIAMQCSTAICFVLSGLALLGIARRWPRLTIVCAVLAAVLPVFSVFGQDRMEPMVAFGFLALSAGLILAKTLPAGGRPPALTLTGLLIVAFGITCGINALSGTCGPFGWHSSTCVFVGASAALCLLGIGIAVAGLRLIRLGPREAVWLPVGVGVSLALYRAGFWHAVHAGQNVNADAIAAIAVTRGILACIILAFFVRLSLRTLLQREALRTANQRLEDEMVQRKLAEEKAREANRIKGAFLANVSHEIRTPMNGILGMIALALDSTSDNERRDCLDAAKGSAEGLLVVINDILDFSKIEAGKLTLEPVDFSLRENLAQTLKPLTLSAEQKGLYLRCHVDTDVSDAVVGDPVRLRQILINLVGNAIKFTTSGGVTVSVQNDSQEAGQTVIHFTVQDTGIGIPSERQKEIFASFTQGDDSTTRKYGGTGLGLTISRQLTAMFGGRIWVESEPGKGSSFHFTVCLGVAVEAEIVAS